MEMKKLILIASIFMFMSCGKEDTVAPTPTPCVEEVVQLFGPRQIKVVANAKISTGGLLLDSITAQTGDVLTIFIPVCGEAAKLDVGYVGNTYQVACVDTQFLPWMVTWTVPE